MDSNQKKIAALIHRVGLKYNLSDAIIRELTSSPYLFTHTIVKELDLSEVKTEGELEEFKTNFYYKGLGKLHIPFNRVDRKNKQQSSIKDINKRRWKN
jgi:hypothetical protein|tara:strand:- start:20635 stop:20928 length:294 start_codon:yes stop_codon:yes gene_type:complete